MDGYNFVEGAYAYFITSTIVDWLPIFIDPIAVEIVIDNLNYCVDHKYLRINAFVIMPNHLHLILFDKENDNQRLEKTIQAFRSYTGKLLSDHVIRNLPGSYQQLIRSHGRADRNIQIWIPNIHAEGIFSENFYEQKFNYIHQNPVRKGYVNQPVCWRASSASYWMRGDLSPIKLSPIGFLGDV